MFFKRKHDSVWAGDWAAAARPDSRLQAGRDLWVPLPPRGVRPPSHRVGLAWPGPPEPRRPCRPRRAERAEGTEPSCHRVRARAGPGQEPPPERRGARSPPRNALLAAAVAAARRSRRAALTPEAAGPAASALCSISAPHRPSLLERPRRPQQGRRRRIEALQVVPGEAAPIPGQDVPPSSPPSCSTPCDGKARGLRARQAGDGGGLRSRRRPRAERAWRPGPAALGVPGAREGGEARGGRCGVVGARRGPRAGSD